MGVVEDMEVGDSMILLELEKIEEQVQEVFAKQEKLKADYKAKMDRLERRLDKLTEQLNEVLRNSDV